MREEQAKDSCLYHTFVRSRACPRTRTMPLACSVHDTRFSVLLHTIHLRNKEVLNPATCCYAILQYAAVRGST